MKYEKPQIVVLPSALEVVRGVKTHSTPDSICNPGEEGKTSCGYTADE
jgi:hypothetical protein